MLINSQSRLFAQPARPNGVADFVSLKEVESA
jgi:hypothetical protein